MSFARAPRRHPFILSAVEDVRFAELISGIAHELRSPLTSVKGFSSTLIKRWDRFSDEQRYQFVETIHNDAERMARIVSEVVDLARLEAGRLELYPQQTDVGAVAGRAIAQFTGEAGAERIEVDVPPGCQVWADPVRLERVIFNLVENALKYSEEGPVRVQAAALDDTVELVVSDDGVGIDASRVPGLFQGPGPSGQRIGPSGTGLGLLLTKKLVEASGGDISVESRAPQGSTFTVKLPAEGSDADVN
jgi:signal transduction histidine kinase